MADDLKRYLYKQLQSVEGLHAIVVTDRDGVPVIKVANDNAPVHALRPGFLSTFALATDQGSKLGLSKNKSIICYYNTYQSSCQCLCALSVLLSVLCLRSSSLIAYLWSSASSPAATPTQVWS
ncbi:ragulator complex protein LAMTOR3 isoform X2 [Sphaeramia orbicularis]|uniref:ragulator complex protein LAMTOR3 isoform X2 n=1 Tax=Sphaeramia orbicularis TaxID=375764 RepID=UPI001180A6E2|nr:ragulator complex protein LAMTOR3 isoform X2 [Sphaeramia orbicularis]